MTKEFYTKLKNIITQYRVFFYITLVIVLIVLIFFVFIKKNSPQNSDNLKDGADNISEITCGENCVFRLVDGTVVEKGKEKPFLISAVIDNQEEARPQFSLSKAVLVYDAPAEGGINRYLAFFPSDAVDVSEIGPVRSARPYFLDIASEYNSLMLHCGGSPEALALIIRDKKLTLNEFYNSYYFRRYPGFVAPHNVLANFSKLQEYLNEKDLKSSEFISWKFKDEKIVASSSAEKIKIDNGFRDYVVEWNYNSSTNLYYKNLGGQKQLDDSGENISASNLIFQSVQTEILDEALRLRIKLSGEGEATICLDGFCQSGFWKKNSATDRTIFYYEDGREVEFNRGKTWVHLLDDNYSLTF